MGAAGRVDRSHRHAADADGQFGDRRRRAGARRHGAGHRHYGGSDLVCYRAGAPEALAKAQAARWDKVLDFAREQLGARLICAEGVNYVEQPEAARRAILAAVKRIAGTGRRRLSRSPRCM